MRGTCCVCCGTSSKHYDGSGIVKETGYSPFIKIFVVLKRRTIRKSTTVGRDVSGGSEEGKAETDVFPSTVYDNLYFWLTLWFVIHRSFSLQTRVECMRSYRQVNGLEF